FLLGVAPDDMYFTASSSVAFDPSWKYGGLLPMLRKDGIWTVPQSSGLPVTLPWPGSTSSSLWLATPTPALKYAPPSACIASEKCGGVWHALQPPLPRNTSSPRCCCSLSAAL